MRFERVPIIARLTTLSYGLLSIVKCNAWTLQADHSQPVPSHEFVTMADSLWRDVLGPSLRLHSLLLDLRQDACQLPGGLLPLVQGR
jgi:hypothetical protein